MGGPERAATPPPLYGDGVYAVGAAAADDGDDDALMVMIMVMTIFSSSWYDTLPQTTPKAPPAVRSPKAGVSREKLRFEDYFFNVRFFQDRHLHQQHHQHHHQQYYQRHQHRPESLDDQGRL